MAAAHIGLAANDGDFDKTLVQMQRLHNYYRANGNLDAADNTEDAMMCVKAIMVAATIAAESPVPRATP